MWKKECLPKPKVKYKRKRKHKHKEKHESKCIVNIYACANEDWYFCRW